MHPNPRSTCPECSVAKSKGFGTTSGPSLGRRTGTRQPGADRGPKTEDREKQSGFATLRQSLSRACRGAKLIR